MDCAKKELKLSERAVTKYSPILVGANPPLRPHFMVSPNTKDCSCAHWLTPRDKLTKRRLFAPKNKRNSKINYLGEKSSKANTKSNYPLLPKNRVPVK